MRPTFFHGRLTLINWIRDIHATTQWTTSVCTGAILLGLAGLLDGIEATTHWAYVDWLVGFGATAVNQRFVRSGKIVTAAGVAAGIDMALWLAGKIAGAEVAKRIQLALEYDPQPPFDSGNPQKASVKTRTAVAKRLCDNHVGEQLSAVRVSSDEGEFFPGGRTR